jgi:energy-converting hydrogenase Eha subunit B
MTKTLSEAATSTLSAVSRVAAVIDKWFSRLMLSPESTWNLRTRAALLSLAVLWAVKLVTTWAAWGNLTVDSGHEMYVPAVLSEGKMLYRDVWFMYFPAAPYFNSYLFRLFGIHLNVLYLAGSLSALASAAFLFFTGMRLGSWAAGWTAGAVVLLQAFQPTLFCFPLPYAFSAVYGCLAACCFLWMIVQACGSNGQAWVFGAGTVAAVALLLKMEFGVACYVALGILIAVRGIRQNSWKIMLKDLGAILPGVLLCAGVIRWMVSIAGAGFITQENFMSWPTSYFIRVYGKFWLQSTGFSLTAATFAESAYRTLIFLGVWQGIELGVRWKRQLNRWTILRFVLFLLAGAQMVINLTWRDVLLAVFFPQDMVFYVTIAAIVFWAYFFRHPELDRAFAVALLLSFSSLLAFRILLKTLPSGYSIYYNGPAVLSIFLIGLPLLPAPETPRRFAFVAEALVCALCLVSVGFYLHEEGSFVKDYAPWVTARGMIRTWPEMAEHYQKAINFMQEKNAQGESVLLIPEDTSLYFLSKTHCPTRLYLFTPGALVPGKMTNELIDEIERKHVRYLLWSNRTFPEYGVPRFGEDFDQTFGNYLVAHYRPTGSVVEEEVSAEEWTAAIWERKPESGLR